MAAAHMASHGAGTAWGQEANPKSGDCSDAVFHGPVSGVSWRKLGSPQKLGGAPPLGGNLASVICLAYPFLAEDWSTTAQMGSVMDVEKQPNVPH